MCVCVVCCVMSIESTENTMAPYAHYVSPCVRFKSPLLSQLPWPTKKQGSAHKPQQAKPVAPQVTITVVVNTKPDEHNGYWQ